MSLFRSLLPVIICLFVFSLSGCGGGSSEESVSDNTSSSSSTDSTTNTGTGTSTDTGTEQSTDLVYEQPQDVARFLTQATFGPTTAEINALTNQSLSSWFLQQLAEEPSYLMPVLAEMSAMSTSEDSLTFLEIEATTVGFWRNAIQGEDQLRQRVAFALSEILVVSNGGGEVLTDVPSAVAYYQDLLISHAFGNYRDLLEAVTYSPAMGHYLTYQGSEKGDPVTGRMPDENYAREILQLFTLGVVALNSDGTARKDEQGKVIETYDNEDITGLARVFTGLNLNDEANERSVSEAFAMPMSMYPESHSQKEKSFLNTTIAANTPGEASITQALDHIFSHANVAPFISTQLIQRLVTSNPSPEYVARVVLAFENGLYTLPNGESVGEQRRGDLAATVAAILFDEQATSIQASYGGKVREPILRFTHWARAFEVASITPEFQQILWDTTGPSTLMQHPYRAPSVFNYFRPGYIAPGTISGQNELKAPELQIVNASSTAGYSNFISYYIFSESKELDLEEVAQFFLDEEIAIDYSKAAESFVADYQVELALVSQPEQLIEHLDLLLTYGLLSQQTKEHILSTLAQFPDTSEEDQLYKVQLAILLIMTSPDYLIQQ